MGLVADDYGSLFHKKVMTVCRWCKRKLEPASETCVGLVCPVCDKP